MAKFLDLDGLEYYTKQFKPGLANLVDNSIKNKVNVKSGSYTTSTQTDITLSVGEYVLYFGELISNDTDSTKCQVLLRSGETNIVEVKLERGTNIIYSITVNSTVDNVVIRASNTYANSVGDTLTVSNVMLCTLSDWNISQSYVPYKTPYDGTATQTEIENTFFNN